MKNRMGKTTTGINVPLFTDVLVLLTLNKKTAQG
jgi:hypothetical protein